MKLLKLSQQFKIQTNPIALDESKKGLVEFNHVSFAYPGASEPVLKDIDFVAKPGTNNSLYWLILVQENQHLLI